MVSVNVPKDTAVHALPVTTAFPAMKFEELVCVLILVDTVVRTPSTTDVMFAFVLSWFIYLCSFVCYCTVVEIVSYIPQNFFEASSCLRTIHLRTESVSLPHRPTSSAPGH